MTPQEIATDKIAQEWIGRPFKLGSDDCAHLVMAMRAEIGAPITFKGGAKYSTEAGAIRALRKLGYNDLDQACDDLLGTRLETPLFAHYGDVIMVPGEGTLAGGLGIMLNDGRVLIAAAPEGVEPYFQALGHVDPKTGKSLCIAAWRLF
ncbi:MAG: DUF6950 family protein [Pseudomonadota bacterium]|jgi:hypothetical protein